MFFVGDLWIESFRVPEMKMRFRPRFFSVGALDLLRFFFCLMGLAILFFLRFFWFHGSCSPGLWVSLPGFLVTDMPGDANA